MPRKQAALVSQIVAGNDKHALIRVERDSPDTISWWLEQYFRFEVTTSVSSQKVQHRDLQLFLDFIFSEEKADRRVA